MTFALLTALVALAAPPSTLVREKPKPFADEGACSVDHFCWENPLPVGVALHTAWIVAPDDVWTAGDGGALLHLVKERWQLEKKSPTTEKLTALWGSAPNDLWAVGPGVAMHFDGKAWTVIPRTEGSELAGVWGASRDLVFLAGTKLQRFDGHDWKVLFEDPRVKLLAVSGSGPKDVWAVGEETPDSGLPAHLVAVHFDGVAARKTGLPYPSSTATLAVGAPGEAWIGGERGLLLRLLGGAWKRVPSGSESETVVVGGARKGLLAFVGGKGFFELSGGAPLKRFSSPGLSLRSLATGPDGSFCGVGDSTLVRFDGKSLHFELRGSFGELRAIHGSSAKSVWAVGDKGLVLWRSDEGWMRLRAFTAASLRGVYADGTNVYVVGEDGAYRSNFDDFTRIALPAQVALGAVGGSGPDDVWITGAGGATFHFDGKGWSAIPTRTTLLLSSLAVVSPTDVWACGEGREAIHWDGKSWTTHQLPEAVSGIAVGERGAVFVSGGQQIWQWNGQKWLLSMKDAGTLTGLVRTGTGELLAFGEGHLLHEYNGVGWRRRELPPAGALRAGFSIGGTTWLVGSGAAILRRRQ